MIDNGWLVGARLAFESYPFLGRAFREPERKSDFVGNLFGPFEIPSNLEGGITTHVNLTWDQDYRVVALGQVSIDAGQTWFNSIGGGNRGRQFHDGAVLPSSPLGCLVGWIGGGRPFPLVNQSVHTSDGHGVLRLGINDTKGMFHDNTDCAGRVLRYVALVETY